MKLIYSKSGFITLFSYSVITYVCSGVNMNRQNTGGVVKYQIIRNNDMIQGKTETDGTGHFR